ncbi:MAG: ATP-grasp fold amidoligase family protein [Actinomycetes bacterium]
MKAETFCSSCGVGPSLPWNICPECGQPAPVVFENLDEGIRRREYFAILRQKAEGEALSYNHKVWKKMAYDRNPILPIFADKLLAKEYVAKKIGQRYLQEIYSVAEHPRDITWDDLPEEYVVKVNHASGGLIMISTGADRTEVLPERLQTNDWPIFKIHPDNADIGKIQNLTEQWLSQDFTWRPDSLPEWAYQGISRKVFVEELLHTEQGYSQAELQNFVFNGKLRLIRYCPANFKVTQRMSDFDPEWNLFPTTYTGVRNYQQMEIQPEKPNQLREIIDICEILGAEVDAVRVDMYFDSGQIRIGELTNYPNAGTGLWHPIEFNFEIAKWWKQEY